ncbi:hypothetical protein C7H19_19980 [Aphanothece hegewaldii CCALA 016]|uniref:Uncharacterized protein n=1 Tax=Aphanothece hegewaldii CCALA 016 TaxID=2107694 RepID=A0A2T1LT20_9CHRO|nr:hypothetical protein [Aphanothece hegewaldii]PSF33451.1 hypothetical protein C7H19_19980 [Aphanothece hegewaldii CCALA 016]
MTHLEISKLSVYKKASAYFINLEDGLRLLGKNKEWLKTLEHCPSRFKRLQQKGFTGETTIMIIDSQQKMIEMISYTDWLALNAFLATNNNHKSIQILQYYAQYGFRYFCQKSLGKI